MSPLAVLPAAVLRYAVLVAAPLPPAEVWTVPAEPLGIAGVLRVSRLAVFVHHRLSPGSVGVGTLASCRRGTGVRVICLTLSPAPIRGGFGRAPHICAGVRVVRRAPVRAAVWSVG